jgi:hypothetical protein
MLRGYFSSKVRVWDLMIALSHVNFMVHNLMASKVTWVPIGIQVCEDCNQSTILHMVFGDHLNTRWLHTYTIKCSYCSKHTSNIFASSFFALPKLAEKSSSEYVIHVEPIVSSLKHQKYHYHWLDLNNNITVNIHVFYNHNTKLPWKNTCNCKQVQTLN